MTMPMPHPAHQTCGNFLWCRRNSYIPWSCRLMLVPVLRVTHLAGGAAKAACLRYHSYWPTGPCICTLTRARVLGTHGVQDLLWRHHLAVGPSDAQYLLAPSDALYLQGNLPQIHLGDNDALGIL